MIVGIAIGCFAGGLLVAACAFGAAVQWLRTRSQQLMIRLLEHPTATPRRSTVGADRKYAVTPAGGSREVEMAENI